MIKCVFYLDEEIKQENDDGYTEIIILILNNI